MSAVHAPAFDAVFQLSLPLPLARLYARAHHAKGERERHDHAFHLVESTLKMAASALVARYRTCGERSQRVDAALRTLSLPSLGHWRTLFQELLSFLGKFSRRDPWVQRIIEQMRAVPEDKSLGEVFGVMASAAQHAGRGSTRVTALDLLELLPTYRNAMSDAHGGIKADPSAYRAPTIALLGLVHALLLDGAILGGGRLVYAEEVKVGIQGEQRAIWMDLSGTTAMRRQPYEGEPTSEKILPGRLYLQIGEGEHLALHPLIYYQAGEVLDQVFFLNRARMGSRGIQFLSYTTGEFYMPGRDPVGDVLVNDLKDLLSWVIEEKVDSKQLEQLAAESRSDAKSQVGTGTEAEPETAGTVLGDFEILGELGRGGMALVYLAKQRSLGRMVALKVLPPLLRDSPVALARFKQEVRALSRCDHPNVVKILSSGEADGTYYYAMEYIDGGDLADIAWTLQHYKSSGAAILREGHFDKAASSASTHPRGEGAGGLPEAERIERQPIKGLQEGRDIAFRLASVIRDAARGIHHIHEHGIVHRDLKPQNIMVTRHDHRPVIMDLGLAKMSDVSRSLTLDKASILGTLRYMPPEQLQRNLLEVDARADVYALGTVLYELACLHPMLDGDTEERLTAQILFEEPPPPQKVNSRIPTDLATIISKATRKDPKERYASATDMAEDLDRFVHGEAISAKPPTLGYLLRLFVKRHRAAVLSCALAIALFAALLASWMVSLRSAWKGEIAAREVAQAALKKEESAREVTEEALKVKAEALGEKEKALLERSEALRRSEGLRLAAESLSALPRDPGLALLLAIEGHQREPGALAKGALMKAVEELREQRTLVGHDGPVYSAAFSPDGRRVLTGSSATARIWDVAAGPQQPPLVLTGHESYVLLVKFSPDGQRALTGSYDGTARIWDVTTGRPLLALKAFRQRSDISAAFSPDGRRVVMACPEKKAQIWDATTGEALTTLTGHVGELCFAQYSPDGALVVTGSYDKTARIWDAATGKELAVLGGHESTVRSAAFSPDGQRIVTAAMEKVARVWDVASGKEIAKLAGHEGGIYEAAVSPDGQLVVTASGDSTARLWELSSGRPVATLGGHRAYVNQASFSGDGRLVLTASGDLTARIWEVATAKEAGRLLGHQSWIYSATFSHDGERVLTASSDGTTRLWSTRSLKDVLVLKGHGSSATFAAFTPDGKRVATASWDKTARVWDASTGEGLATMKGHEEAVTSASVSADGGRLVTASQDKTARIWETSSGKELVALKGHQDWVTCAVFSRDGQRVLTASADGTARIWDASSGKELASLRGHQGMVACAVFSAGGERVLTGSRDSTARLWDAATGKSLAEFSGHNDWVATVAFSPDGEAVLTASDDGTSRLWDPMSGKELTALRGHTDYVTSAVFSLDGRRILTASHDRTARIWDASSGKALARLRGHWDYVTGAVFGRRGDLVLTRSRDGTARVWDSRSGEPILMMAHDGAVTSATFSPDGERALTSSQDAAVRIWPLKPPLERAIALKPRELTPDERQNFQIGTVEERRAYARAWKVEERRRALDAARQSWLADPKRAQACLSYASLLVELARDLSLNVSDQPLHELVEKGPAKVEQADGSATGVQGLLGEIRARKDAIRDAIILLEDSLARPDAKIESPWKLERLRAALLPDLVSHASIDASVEGPEVLIGEGARWRFHRGVKEPSQGIEWTQPTFDDAAWESGASGSAGGDFQLAAGSDELQESCTTLYLRRFFEVPDVSFHEAPSLSVRGDSGLVAYLNGTEIGRVRAGQPGVRVPFNGVATEDAEGATPGVELHFDAKLLRPGRNLLAIQALTSAQGAESFSMTPLLLARTAVDRRHDSSRLTEFRRMARGQEAAARLAYLEGRLLQRDGKDSEAISKFEEVLERDKTRAEPFVRLGETLRRSGKPAAAEARLRQALEAEVVPREALWDSWYSVSILDLKRTAAELLETWPRSSVQEDRGDDLRWGLEQLLANGAIRINCGGEDYTSPGGTFWGQDRFFSSGFLTLTTSKTGGGRPFKGEIMGTEDDPLYQTERWFDEKVDLNPALYRIPGPPGDYRIVFHFAEVVYNTKGSRIFNVFLEGNKVLEHYEPVLVGFATAEQRAFDAKVTDGFLDICFTRGPADCPKISALEVLVPNLVNYASLDDALKAREILIPEGAEWRFFRGKKEPSPGLEWTALDFDDASWEKGPSGFGFGDEDDATVLADMQNEYTTVYIRHTFEIPGPSTYRRLALSAGADDGFVAYLNGTEVRRVAAGEPGKRIPFDGVASETAEEPIEPVVVLLDPSLLKSGKNVMALQGLNVSKESSDLSLIPVLVGEEPEASTRDEKYLEAFRGKPQEENFAKRLLYLEGRVLQRAKRYQEAAEKLRELTSLEAFRAEPNLALAEALLAAGDPSGAEKALSVALTRSSGNRKDLLDLWAAVSLRDLHRTPAEMLASLSGNQAGAGLRGKGASTGYAADLHWLLERLQAGESIRINCGGDDYKGRDGKLWGKDRFFLGGRQAISERTQVDIQGTDDDPLYLTERWFPASESQAGYRIPLPPGDYRISLHFAEFVVQTTGTFQRDFSISLEGRRIFTRYHPKVDEAEVHAAESSVADGHLDIDFAHGSASNPKISAIEVQPMP